jgi:two-component system response regulator HydG
MSPEFSRLEYPEREAKRRESQKDDAEAFLVLRTRNGWSKGYRLAPETVVSIGRGKANQIVLSDQKCSRHHCEVFRAAEGWMVRDLNSRNGTLINKTSVEGTHPLLIGDVIRVGQAELLFTTEHAQPPDPGADAPDEVSKTEFQSQILQRRSETRFLTESELLAQRGHDAMGVLARLCRLVLRMVACPDAKELSETVLEGVLNVVPADIGAVLLFSDDVPDRSDPAFLRLIAYRGPESAPYQRVSGQLSKTTLSERQAILAMDVQAEESGAFDSLVSLEARSVIGAPIRFENRLLGLLHLYSLDASKSLDADALDIVLAVADQMAVALENLQQKETLARGLMRVRDQNESLQRLLEIESDLVGDSPTLKQLRSNIARIAASDVTTLVRGESGVGKELVARAIHFNSARRTGPFVCLNCAAMTETLLESELFGHEKGAFTGATKQKVGKFEQADEGTLFLDEVGETSAAVQVKLLRVIEGYPFERVGGNAPVEVDVRVVAATNLDLESAVRDGAFRQDLFYRLQVLQVQVPPLRDHASDIPQLAEHFLDRCRQRQKRPDLTVTDAALMALRQYEWPGNVRELRNVIERTVVLCDSDEIGPADIHFLTGGQMRDASSGDAPFEPLSLEALERKQILRTLRFTEGNKREAARLLGVNRSTLDRKLERYGIDLEAT